MIIYKTTNLMNSKVYVGKACGIRALPSSLYLGSGVWIKLAGMAVACVGKNHHMYGKHHSEETKRRMSLSGKGLVRPEETKLNISRALSGRVLSAEHRQKLRDSGSRYWALKRNAAANVQSA